MMNVESVAPKPREHVRGRPTSCSPAGWRRLCLMLVALTITLTCTGCPVLLSDAFHKHLVSNYLLVAVDVPEDMCIVWDNHGDATARISAVVVDVGWDAHFIVATRRAPDNPGGVLFYYYVDIAKDSPDNYSQAVTGPLTEQEFAAAKAELGLPEFTLHYPELR